MPLAPLLRLSLCQSDRCSGPMLLLFQTNPIQRTGVSKGSLKCGYVATLSMMLPRVHLALSHPSFFALHVSGTVFMLSLPSKMTILIYLCSFFLSRNVSSVFCCCCFLVQNSAECLKSTDLNEQIRQKSRPISRTAGLFNICNSISNVHVLLGFYASSLKAMRLPVFTNQVMRCSPVATTMCSEV